MEGGTVKEAGFAIAQAAKLMAVRASFQTSYNI